MRASWDPRSLSAPSPSLPNCIQPIYHAIFRVLPLMGSFFFILFLLSTLFSLVQSPSLSHGAQPNDAPPSAPDWHSQAFHFMKPRLYPSDSGIKKRGKETSQVFGQKPLGEMLPRSFVPPSGSSQCHNDGPEFVNFCGEDSTVRTMP